MTRQAQRRRSTRTSNAAPSTGARVGRFIAAWLAFTLFNDTQATVYRLPHVLVNWLVIVGLGLAWWQRWDRWWQPLILLTLAGVIYTMGRAARQLPRRREAVDQLYFNTRRSCGHPARPDRTDLYVTVTGWRGAGKPTRGVVRYQPDSAAASPATRALAERAVEKTLEIRPNQGFTFDHTTAGEFTFAVLPADDPRVKRRKTRLWVDKTLSELLPKAREDFEVQISWDDTAEQADVPAVIDVGFGAAQSSDPRFRAEFEHRFDGQVQRGGREWVYEWAPGQVQIAGVDPEDPPAVRKRAARKVSDVLTTAVGVVGGRTAGNQADVQVARWIDDGRAGGNTPVQIRVSFGTADFSDVARRYDLTDRADQALETEWPDRVWLADWAFGHAGSVTLNAVPLKHKEAERKAETKRVRQVVVNGFPRTPGLDVEVVRWHEVDARQRVLEMEVNYGTADMTDPERRRLFETHMDAQTVDNDWRFDWTTPGRLTILSVPPLPQRIPFPAEGSEELAAWHATFRAGQIDLGPAKGGYRTTIDLTKSPHVLVGGSTGKGKSVTLTMILYGALMNPDRCELLVVDPKVTDFTWTPGYPNVLRYAVTDVRKAAEEILGVCKAAFERMNARQTLLSQYQVENLGELRRGISDGRITDLTEQQVPRRLIVFFDEGGAAFTPSKNKEIKELQDEARSYMDQIGMLGRAMEVNIVMAAQKPSADNIGTALREQLVNRVAVGQLNTTTSVQVLGNTLATTGLTGAPKGRGWFVDDAGRELLFQSYYLPKRDEPDTDNPSLTLQGVQERVAGRLTELGYVPVQTPTTLTRLVDPNDPDSGLEEVVTLVTEWKLRSDT